MIPLAAISIALTSEALIIGSNFLLAFATMLLFWASMREQHKTIQAIVKNDNSLLRRLIRTLGKKSNDPN